MDKTKRCAAPPRDPELAAIARELRETVQHAIRPGFREELHNECLRRFREAMNSKGDH